MSVVAFTFGSLGDIITLLQLADRVRKALYNTKDSSTEFRDVIRELDTVVFTVTEVQRTLSLPGSNRLSQSVENALYHAVGICLDIITKMNERIAMRRMASLGGEYIGTMAIDAWQRIGWTLFKKEELLLLRRRLSGQIEAMNTLLALAQGDRMDRIGSQMASVNNGVSCVSHEVASVSEAVSYLREESREPYVLIREIHRCVTNLPHKLGYLWEGDSGASDRPVTLTDILGHTVVLPWELVATEELLHEFLVFYFRDKPCLGTVQARRYLILNLGCRQQRVSFHTWNQLWFDDPSMKRNQEYRPGSRLDMRAEIIVRRHQPRALVPWTMMADRSLLDAGFPIRRPGHANIAARQLHMAFLGAVNKSPRAIRDTARLSVNEPNTPTESEIISGADSEIAGSTESIRENNDIGIDGSHYVVWEFSYGTPPSASDGLNGPSREEWHRGWRLPDPCAVMTGSSYTGQLVHSEPYYISPKSV